MSGKIPLDGLGAWLADEIAGGGDDVAVLAGHFAIFSAGAAADDLLGHEARSAAGSREMLDFTRLTWRAACKATSAPSRTDARVVVLVDDIQFVRPLLADRSMSERLAAALATAYLDAVPRLPQFHTDELAAHGIAADRVLRASDARWIFSERKLRIDAVPTLRRQLAEPDRHPRMVGDDDGGTVNVSLADGADYCLVHSGRTSCVGGYMELISQLHGRGVRRLIALIPMRCLGQVALATTLAQELFDLPALDVLNVAVPDPALGIPATIASG